MKTGRHGFSLLEILVVVGIMAGLLALAMPYYQDYLESSRRAVMEANFRAVRKALMEYMADTGKPLPTDGADLKAKLVPKYLMNFPTDPEPSTVTSPVPEYWGYNPLSNPPWGAKYHYLVNQ